MMRFGQRRRARGSGLPLSSFVAVGLIAVMAAAGYVMLNDRIEDLPRSVTQVTNTTFAVCGAPPHRDCVIDGDTFYLGTQSIRLVDVDAPEIGEPRCAAEAELGAEAARRLQALLNAGPFEVRATSTRDFDQYDRLLRSAVRDGQSLGAVLADEGLARRPNEPDIWCD